MLVGSLVFLDRNCTPATSFSCIPLANHTGNGRVGMFDCKVDHCFLVD